MTDDERLIACLGHAVVELLGNTWGNDDKEMFALRLEIGYLLKHGLGAEAKPASDPADQRMAADARQRDLFASC